MLIYSNRYCSLDLHTDAELTLVYRVPGGFAREIAGPRFRVDGEVLAPIITAPVPIETSAGGRPAAGSDPGNGALDLVYSGTYKAVGDVALTVHVRAAHESPILRLRYSLRSTGDHELTNGAEGNDLRYLSYRAHGSVTEIRFSEFNELIHSFCPTENPVCSAAFDSGLALMGPMLVESGTDWAFLVAYEHGSQYPDAFIEYRLRADRSVELVATKGNYCHGQTLAEGDGFETVWLQLGAVVGAADDPTEGAADDPTEGAADDPTEGAADDPTEGAAAGRRGSAEPVSRLAHAYRSFQLRFASPNSESRKPYIFYNTWAYQERNKWWNGKAYLDSMNHDRMLAEIDVAHRMGVEVFVLDTGWYEKTGDWTVSSKRFPDGLAGVRHALESRGMKLGLWFNPRAAAISSRMLADHQDCIATRGGTPGSPRPIWETEESHSLCLVSRYWKSFADELIRLVREVGVTYFKWDAIGQYGCDSPDHEHGTRGNTPEERSQAYAFLLGRYMSRIVDRLCAECPEAIVDFDITEGGRHVGLGFLSSGKYFLINNGPYYRNFDIPHDRTTWSNIFVHPGPARTWICRSPLTFDRWIPSVLFLTHYLPDEPAESQIMNIASLILGQNGIWGDLLSISQEGVERFARLLDMYKQVRHDITAASPVRAGKVGGAVEVHEKVSADTGRGAVCVFTSAAADTVYVTESRVADGFVATDGVSVTRDEAGRGRVRITPELPGAGIVFFGVA